MGEKMNQNTTTSTSIKLGIVARMDLGGGLCHQSLNLCKMLNPTKVLLIDSTPFNKARQHPELYSQFNVDKVWGFPNFHVYRQWLNGLTHVLTAETFYNDRIVNHCLRNKIKTYVQCNYEFMDSMVNPQTPPTLYLVPSKWKLSEISNKYPAIYLPPPLIINEFKDARQANFKRAGKRFVHIVGKHASKDRNGTQGLIDALKYTNEDFELVIKAQTEIPYQTTDRRVTFDIQNTAEQQDLYKDFDAMILPRRYGGLCLPMNEALASGLPVIMTDISPNNEVLPKKWLVDSTIHDQLVTRMVLDVYNPDPKLLAKKIDMLCNINISQEKTEAFELAMQYAHDNLREKYINEFER